MTTLKFNNDVKLIISDVDETIAGIYMDAESDMILELEKLLRDNKIIFMITGHGLEGVQKRITNKIDKHLRKGILIAHCSGAEVQGFDNDGEIHRTPFYDKYETIFSQSQKKIWREIVQQIVSEFKLKVYPTMPESVFIKESKRKPLSIMLDDRGPQITFEIVNATNLSQEQVKELGIQIPKTRGQFDLRVPILNRASELFQENNLPITPRLAGTFAIDLAIKDISKKTAVEYIINDKKILAKLELPEDIINHPNCLEAWGDKFSTINGGTDRHISEALPKNVRSISFREENPDEFLSGYNTVVWNGRKHLQHGLLEFLKSR
jgi:hydroxymethylpyrimidine pyrophosphatase-like HAD family hydrolase